MLNFRLIIIITLFYTTTARSDDLEFGVAAINDNLSCISFQKNSLPEGYDIGVVVFGSEQSYVEGKLGNKLDSCSVLEKANIGGAYFEFFAAKKIMAPAIGIAVLGRYKPLDNKGIVSLIREDLKERIYFRVCASGEGMHLSSWLGVPLRDKKLWSQYLYLGYDLDPDCQEADLR